ncbi:MULTISPECIES: bifunctional acetyl-CoA hydrolase/transferase family protein/GNAT family N-acetyltransferase [Desulfococcus]|uniref:Acetyl-CoA hydrolase/transferase C-terminal domain containing protein n=1 Tax=Desulfococcus multivorans DSM 2059 TaxID=1121405 RepID=S7VE68_DESML|nr:bifunctional acetyl-CoA hydrolase/transferase family protein/GNAT family N-acetyltransferase [Desulfococcus multivorans]AOY59263.1 Cat2: 4-hydroxybutyrate coenzyme A transferase [Desulfococcus multivorans]AQV01485.1 acetyl-CoA hydrolase [Desulfococcus multivorans]EPR45029.1 Acetyl-CoA hydrolase/transferase C-terminal domain containing protein [Desulfococcus multivorans DSM 2059]SKA26765.1 Acyl-CoA hydrolase [Desulfococcus multivorans DSM 2059]
MDLNQYCPEKVLDAAKAISNIRQGSRVFIGTGCGEPQHLIKTMVQDMNMQDIMVYQMLSSTLSQFVEDETFLKRFSLKLFFISWAMRRAASVGKIDYIPTYLSQIPKLFYSGRIALDVALIQVSPPDAFGYCSLGVSVDITLAGMTSAKLVIAQVNSRMPNTWGDSFVHVDDIDYFVLHDEPLVESVRILNESETEISRRIGMYISQVVDDGATIQIGFGYLPNAVLKFLDKKKDLGIHTQVITDGLLSLLEKKVITNKKKTFIPGRIVASLCMGSQKIYDYVHNNPMFYFRSSDFVNNPKVIAQNDNFISISSALQVDLTGQVCADSLGNKFYSGIGDQVDFLRGAALSDDGFSIIALPSTAHTEKGTVSRIVASLSDGAGLATTRADVDIVITEYGIAELQGKSIYQRVMELTQIAHPQFRNDLIEEAKSRGYIFPDQLPPAAEDLIFLEEYKESMELKNGKTILFRPLLPSDEFAYRNFFYSLRKETIYRRFFYEKKIFSHEMIQGQYAGVDYRRNMFLIGLVQKKRHKQIVAIGTYLDSGNSLAEVAFVVREDYQGMGIASFLLKQLERIARKNGFTMFTATTLRENASMCHVFKKRYPNATYSYESSEIEIVMDFSDSDKEPT